MIEITFLWNEKKIIGEVSFSMSYFDPIKCKMMTISRKRTPSKLNLYFGNFRDTGDEVGILGVTLDRKLSVASRAACMAL